MTQSLFIKSVECQERLVNLLSLGFWTAKTYFIAKLHCLVVFMEKIVGQNVEHEAKFVDTN